MSQCYIFDYQDSFTHNIASELRLHGVKVEVIPFGQIESFLRNFKTQAKTIFIHGPGPGHPTDYKHLFPVIEQSFKLPNVFHGGFCLGHQLFCTLWGGRVIRSKFPMHGQQVEIEIPEWKTFDSKFYRQKILVQRYNSLSLPDTEIQKLKTPMNFQYYSQNGEVLMTEFHQGLSYQFHPESVGTSYRFVFFRPLLRFLL